MKLATTVINIPKMETDRLPTYAAYQTTSIDFKVSFLYLKLSHLSIKRSYFSKSVYNATLEKPEAYIFEIWVLLVLSLFYPYLKNSIE